MGGVSLHLLSVLPSRRCVRGREAVEAVFSGMERGAVHAHVETHRAPSAALGIELHTLGPRHPIVDVVVRVNKVDAELGGVALVLLLADLVLLARVDVRVVEEDRHLMALRHHLLYHGAAAWCAARVEQHVARRGSGGSGGGQRRRTHH